MQLNKKENKLKFLKFYEHLNSSAIFKINNKYNIPLINVGNEKLIFYCIEEEFNFISNFEFIHDVKNWLNYDLKMFKQDENFCYVLLLNVILIIRINYEQKYVECLFRCCLQRTEINKIFPVKNGLLFGSSQDYYFQYLAKINGKFEFVNDNVILENGNYNDKIVDIIKDEDHLMVIGENKIFEL